MSDPAGESTTRERRKAETAVIEEEIWALLQAGDARTALALAADAWGSGIMALCARNVGHQARGEELYQAVWEQAARSIQSFRYAGSFRGWLYRIAARDSWKVAQEIRRSARRKAPEDAVPEDDASKEFWRRTSFKLGFRDLLLDLPEDDRTLIALRFESELSWKEVAITMSDASIDDEARLKTVANTLASRWRHVRKRLLQQATMMGLVPEGLRT